MESEPKKNKTPSEDLDDFFVNVAKSKIVKFGIGWYDLVEFKINIEKWLYHHYSLKDASEEDKIRTSPKNYQHAFALFDLENGKTILVEFGMYDSKREPFVGDKQYFLNLQDGLRFYEAPYELLKTKFDIEKEESYRELDFANKDLTLFDVLMKVSTQARWGKDDYDLLFHNCQYLVASLILILKGRVKCSHEGMLTRFKKMPSVIKLVLSGLALAEGDDSVSFY